MKRLLYSFLLCWLTLSLSYCGGIAGLATSGDSVDAADPLSEGESSLYDAGPIDLPVTISKLDSVDANLVTVEYSDSGIAESVVSGARSLATTTTTSGYTGIGEPEAVKSEQIQTYGVTKLYVINTATGDAKIVSLEADGSFSFTLQAAEGDIIAFAPMKSDELQIGLPLYADKDNGVFTLTLTNADNLSVNQPVVITADGYTYFSLQQGETFTLYRRNLDGSKIETVATGIPEQIRFISPTSDGEVSYFTQDGKGYVARPAATSTSSLTQSSTRYVTTWDEPLQVFDLNQSLNDPDSYIPAAAKIFISSEKKLFLVNKLVVNGAQTQPFFNLMVYFDPVAIEFAELLPTNEFKDAAFDVGSQDELYAFVSPIDNSTADGFGPYSLYRLNMLDGAQIWDNRTLLYTFQPGRRIISLDVSSTGTFVFVVTNPEAPGVEDIYAMDDSASPVFIAATEKDFGRLSYSEWIAVSPGADMADATIVTCGTDNTTGEEYLALHRIGQDDTNTWYRITDTTTNGCAGAYNIDDAGRIVFYRAMKADDGSDLAPQLSLIDLNLIDPDLIVLDE